MSDNSFEWQLLNSTKTVDDTTMSLMIHQAVEGGYFINYSRRGKQVTIHTGPQSRVIWLQITKPGFVTNTSDKLPQSYYDWLKIHTSK